MTDKPEPVELSYGVPYDPTEDAVAWKPTVAGPWMIAVILVMFGGFWMFLFLLYFVG